MAVRRREFWESELTDIYEETPIRLLERKIEENIEYLLKEVEGLYDPKKLGSIVVPPSELYWECDDRRCWYSASFEIFDPTGREIVARGEVAGHMMMIDEDKGIVEISDLTVVMAKRDVEKLRYMRK